MLIERNLSIALGAISAAVVLPHAGGRGAPPGAAGGGHTGFAAMIVVGALGVFMGAAIAAGDLSGGSGWSRVRPVAALVVWTAFALGLAACAGVEAARAVTAPWTWTLGLAAAAPLGALALALRAGR